MSHDSSGVPRPAERRGLPPLALLLAAAVALLLAIGVGAFGKENLTPAWLLLLGIALLLTLRGVTRRLIEGPSLSWERTGLTAFLGVGGLLGLAASFHVALADPQRPLLVVVSSACLVGAAVVQLACRWGESRSTLAGALAAGSFLPLVALLFTPDESEPWRLLWGSLVAVGLVSSGLVLLTGEGLRERSLTIGTLLVAAFLALVSSYACDVSWDSFRLLLGVAAGVGLAGALLLLMPRGLRRATLVVLAAVHFGGILSAVFSVAPPGAAPSWVALTVWTVFYRPYLQFMYMNNAYHFYSPEPGPPTLLWFRLEFEEGDPLWVKLPNREDFPTRLQYQRRLALTESTNMNTSPPPRLAFERGWFQRTAAAGRTGIPVHTEIDPILQYREPSPYSKKMIAAYAHRVATAPEYACRSNPEARLKAVKVYRVIHDIAQPAAIKDGDRDTPLDPTLYRPFYMGEFGWREGRDPETGEPQREWVLLRPEDPLLYWLIPIKREPKLAPGEIFIPARTYEMEIKDYLAVHAGDRTKP